MVWGLRLFFFNCISSGQRSGLPDYVRIERVCKGRGARVCVQKQSSLNREVCTKASRKAAKAAPEAVSIGVDKLNSASPAPIPWRASTGKW